MRVLHCQSLFVAVKVQTCAIQMLHTYQQKSLITTKETVSRCFTPKQGKMHETEMNNLFITKAWNFIVADHYREEGDDPEGKALDLQVDHKRD